MPEDPVAEKLAEFLRAAYEIQALTDQIRRGQYESITTDVIFIPRHDFLTAAVRDLLDHGVVEAAV